MDSQLTTKKIDEETFLKILKNKKQDKTQIRFYIVRAKQVMSSCVLQVNNKNAWYDVATVNKNLSGIRKVKEMHLLFNFVEEFLKQEKIRANGETNQKFAKFLKKRTGYLLKQIPHIPGGKPKVKVNYNPRRK